MKPLSIRRPLCGPQHAVITGGSSGLGLELAKQLAARGLRLTLVARDEAKLRAAAGAITAQHPAARVGVVSVDVSDRVTLEPAIAALAEDTGRIDALINSAGVLREGYFELLGESDFREVMDVGFFGTVNAIRATLPYLKVNRGRVVNIASVAGLTGVFGYTPYCAAKHALVGFTESIPKLGVREIALATLAGIDADRRTIIPGTRTKALVTAQRLAPAIGNAIARHRIKAVYQGPPAAASRGA